VLLTGRAASRDLILNSICSEPRWTIHESPTNLPIPVVNIAERKVNTNLNGRQATPTGQPNNTSAVKYPYATQACISYFLDNRKLTAVDVRSLYHVSLAIKLIVHVECSVPTTRICISSRLLGLIIGRKDV
jgi:hypothetical protein